MIYFTSSWDDGSVHDMKLAELLLKYDQKATFFIPLYNVEKRQVISQTQIEELSKNFEIGAHTVNHKYLTTISNAQAEYEIKQSKKELETIINKPVPGFCFPGGKYKQIHLKYVWEAGFLYARTVNMFRNSIAKNVLDTTLHAYNHSRFTYFIHLIKRGYFLELFQNLVSIVANNNWDKLLFEVLDKHVNNDLPQKATVIHLWGHSWELQENDAWQQLEQFFKQLNESQVVSKTNFEVSQLTSV